MFFCDDLDLLPWEPSLFLAPAFAHQQLLRDASATLTGTTLVTAAPVLTDVLPGMVAAVTLADDSLTQLLEVVAVIDPSHATVSALRARNAQSALPPLTGGAVKLTILTFRPQIAAVGDALLGMIGVTSDRTRDPIPPTDNLAGFRTATVFGTLAALCRTLAGTPDATALMLSKATFYEGLAGATRRAICAAVDRDGDGVPETITAAALPTFDRA